MQAVSPKRVLNATLMVALFACASLVSLSSRYARAEMARSVGAPVLPISRLRPLASKSGYIFAGTVTSIAVAEPHNAKDIPTVRITFHVNEGVRGVRTGQTLIIREWMGAWENGQRYRVGEKAFLFLYSPSKLGLTSAVGGGQGRFSINRTGGVGVSPVLLPVGPQNGPQNGPQKPVYERVPGRISIPLRDFERAVRLAGGNAP
jgi:hypothetical protein